jgi:predicted flap endonuclease-1-like 5' DNA nuclease
MAHLYGLLALWLGLPLAQEAEVKEFPWWAYVLIALVLLAFLAYLIWWLLNRNAEPEVAPSHGVEEIKTAATAIPSAPVALPEVDVPAVELPEAELPEVAVRAPAIPAMPDDLKLIEGIGPKIASVLNAAGITTFAQVAGLDVDRIRNILELADPRLLHLADPATWPEQARLAAAGDWDAFRALTERLKGGRRA